MDIDMKLPLKLAHFPEVMAGRVIYSLQDVIFLCRRDVARTLLGDVMEQLKSRAGNERRVFPLDYDRIFRSDLSNGLMLQVFPDIGSEAFRTAVQEKGPLWFKV